MPHASPYSKTVFPRVTGNLIYIKLEALITREEISVAKMRLF